MLFLASILDLPVHGKSGEVIGSNRPLTKNVPILIDEHGVEFRHMRYLRRHLTASSCLSRLLKSSEVSDAEPIIISFKCRNSAS